MTEQLMRDVVKSGYRRAGAGGLARTLSVDG